MTNKPFVTGLANLEIVLSGLRSGKLMPATSVETEGLLYDIESPLNDDPVDKAYPVIGTPTRPVTVTSPVDVMVVFPDNRTPRVFVTLCEFETNCWLEACVDPADPENWEVYLAP